MSSRHPFLFFIFALLLLVLAVSVILLVLGVDEDIVLYVCWGLEILLSSVVLIALIIGWVRRK